MKRVILHIVARFYEARAARALMQHVEFTEKAEKFFERTKGGAA